MGLLIWVSLVMILGAAIAIAVIIKELRREEIVLIEDRIDRERVIKFLNLPEKSKIKLENEIDSGLHDGEYY